MASQDNAKPHWSATIWVHSEGFSPQQVLFNRYAISSEILPDALLAVRHDACVEPFFFQAVEMKREDRMRYSNVQLSVSQKIASLFGFQHRSQVTMTLADRDSATASHVELAYRDVLLDRSEMARLCSSALNGRSVYQDQSIPYVSGAISFTVKAIYAQGRRIRSGLFDSSTKAVFRSETARFIIMIQMSKEMWDFDPEGSGETLWSKCVDGFLVDLFDRWNQINARHLVTVVLFTRVWYRPDEEEELPSRDFYKVIASEVPSTDSEVLFARMRSGYRNFLRTVNVRSSAPGDIKSIRGILSTASQGCLLEAIHLASSHFTRACNDPDLLRTEKSLLIVTPSTGLFEVDKELLRVATERVVCSGFGIDLVCLAHHPLHPPPLFAIRPPKLRPTSGVAKSHPPDESAIEQSSEDHLEQSMRQYADWTFVKPSWMGAAFYQSHSRRLSVPARKLGLAYTPTTRIYQVQSAGVASNMNSLQIATSMTNFAMPSINDVLAVEDNAYFQIINQLEQEQTATSHSASKASIPTLQIERVRRRDPEPNTPQLETGPQADLEKPSRPSLDMTALPSPARPASPSASSARSISSKTSSRFLRLASGLGKSGASTGATVQLAESEKAAFIRDHGRANRVGTVEEQFKASLSRKISTQRTPSISPLETPPPPLTEPVPSQPIQIFKRTASPSTSQLLQNSGASESSSQSTSTAKAQSWNLDRDQTFQTQSVTKNHSSLEKRYLGPRNTTDANGELAPWLLTVDPISSPPKVPALFASWRHLFASESGNTHIKWKALCSPAALPLTLEDCPSKQMLHGDDYSQSPYFIAVDDPIQSEGNRGVFSKLIDMRLSRGFQFCVGPRAESMPDSKGIEGAMNWSKGGSPEDASVAIMRGNTVHVLALDTTGVAVTRYQRRSSRQTSRSMRYEPEISTLLEDEFVKRIFHISGFDDENWNAIDNYLLHPSISSVGARWTTQRARWVLLPTEIPAHRRGITPAEDSDEEIRLEGIRKLTVLWQKGATTSANRNVELSPLAIEYATADPSIYLRMNLDNSPLLVGNQTVTSTRVVEGQERYTTTGYDLQKLARDLQGPKGIKMRDRYWHLKSHKFCFEGVELISFLVANFENLATREDAVDFGNVLMGHGLFQHVQLKHRFRDGNFFYTLSPAYRLPVKESRSWFGARKATVSSPATPAADQHRSFLSPSLGPVPDDSAVRDVKDARILLSAAIAYDVDPRRKSDRKEMIKLHYDRLHNPANTFHIMAEWENVTSKLIEDAVSNWAASVERYGLRMAQLPMEEVGTIGSANPFRTPYVIKVALMPAHLSHASSALDGSSDLAASSTRHQHCKAILRRNDYILDYEASYRFPTNVEVAYSWADKAGYHKDQYVHRSGALLVQIMDDETFILLANRLNTSRNTPKKREARPGTALSRAHTSKSPFSSPTLKPLREFVSSPTSAPEPKKPKTLMELKEELEKFCADKAALLALYTEMSRAQVAQTPYQKAVRVPSMDASIPSLDLTPFNEVEPLSLDDTLHLEGTIETNKTGSRDITNLG